MLRLFFIFIIFSVNTFTQDWQKAKPPIQTVWYDSVDFNNVHPEYPRPQMVRERWMNLNGLWQYKLVENLDTIPFNTKLNDKILVPFPVESALSGVMKSTDYLWYRKKIEIPKEWNGNRVLLHFGAVDWHSKIYVNGKLIGEHKGGYDPFTFDITNYLTNDKQEIIIGVFDPSDLGDQACGKQMEKPHGIWYTPTTGIWRTVWLEAVPQNYISNYFVETDIDSGIVTIKPEVVGDVNKIEINVLDNGKQVAEYLGEIQENINIKIENPKLWCPKNPNLYDLVIKLNKNENIVDKVTGYFGMRKIELKDDEKGKKRIYFNNKPVFQRGVLDQGFWPDGLYTAPTDNALKFDIEKIKELGLNMERKHVKVEPERWYYWADKLGLLVWQDMPNGKNLTEEGKVQFEKELEELIKDYYNHPSIIMWVIFNEGWGQYDVERLTNKARKLDNTRLLNSTSGWQDMRVGDVIDIHRYPGPVACEPVGNRAIVEGEFGGISLGVDGHTWAKRAWGYRGTENKDELTDYYEKLLRRMWYLKDYSAMSGYIYTQITDVETETNGLFTYDRKILKMDIDRIASANRGESCYILPEESRFVNSLKVSISNGIGSEDIYYTTDGTEPDLTSNKYIKPFVITDSTIVKARAFKEGKPIGYISISKYNKVEGLAPLKVTNELKNGLWYNYYQLSLEMKEGYASHWPLHSRMEKNQENGLTITDSGYVDNFTLDKRKQDELFGFVFTGYIDISKDGLYTFYNEADDGTFFFIDDEKVIGELGLSPYPCETYGAIPLKKGLHKITINYYQAYGPFGLDVYFEGPGLEKQSIPNSILFTKKNK